MAAARERLGCPTIVHKFEVPNCWMSAQPLPRCMEIGLDKDKGYDCSGFVISSMARVLGKNAGNWPPHLRHTRELWEKLGEPLASDEYSRIQPGDAIVFWRTWNMQDGRVLQMPAHIGISTGDPSSDKIRFIRAITDIEATRKTSCGRVLENRIEEGEAPVSDMQILGKIGYVALHELASSTLDDRVPAAV